MKKEVETEILLVSKIQTRKMFKPIAPIVHGTIVGTAKVVVVSPVATVITTSSSHASIVLGVYVHRWHAGS